MNKSLKDEVDGIAITDNNDDSNKDDGIIVCLSTHIVSAH
jgi:hypothetical protein